MFASLREMFGRYTFITFLKLLLELAVSQLETFGLINPYLVMLENLGAQGKSIKLNRYRYRYALLELCRNWSKRCIASWKEKRRQRSGMTNRVRNAVKTF